MQGVAVVAWTEAPPRAPRLLDDGTRENLRVGMPDAIIKRLESSPTRLSPLRIRAQPARPTGVRIRNAPKARDTPEDAWLAAEVSVFTQLVNALEDTEEGEPRSARSAQIEI